MGKARRELAHRRGSGKSTLALCLAGLVQPPEATGSMRLAGTQLMGAGADDLRALRWSTVALALQGAPFNPVATVGAQVAEPPRDRRGMSKPDARRRSITPGVGRKQGGRTSLFPPIL